MMAEKARLFDDKETLVNILAAKKPRMQKQLGREVKNFDENKWKDQCFDIVAKGNYYNFKEHPNLKKKLFNTGKKLIAEGSSHDTIWGIGIDMNETSSQDLKNWNGTNLLGQAIMHARKKLLSEENIDFQDAIGDYSYGDM